MKKNDYDSYIGYKSKNSKFGLGGKYQKEEYQSDCNKALEQLQKERNDFKTCIKEQKEKGGHQGFEDSPGKQCKYEYGTYKSAEKLAFITCTQNSNTKLMGENEISDFNHTDDMN